MSKLTLRAATVCAVVVVAIVASLLCMPTVESAYTYQKLGELMPELRHYLGRTHLGTLKARQFNDDDNAFGQQIRERKSNNLRNLMRIGKRNVLSSPAATLDDFVAAEAAARGDDELGVSTGTNPLYYFPRALFQGYRPQSVWLRR